MAMVAAGVVVGAGVAIVAAPVLIGAAGFTAGGVAAGSAAAAAQSALYGGAATGAFSVLQSAGVLGIGLASKAVIGVTGAGFGAAISSFWK